MRCGLQAFGGGINRPWDLCLGADCIHQGTCWMKPFTNKSNIIKPFVPELLMTFVFDWKNRDQLKSAWVTDLHGVYLKVNGILGATYFDWTGCSLLNKVECIIVHVYVPVAWSAGSGLLARAMYSRTFLRVGPRNQRPSLIWKTRLGSLSAHSPNRVGVIPETARKASICRKRETSWSMTIGCLFLLIG